MAIGDIVRFTGVGVSVVYMLMLYIYYNVGKKAPERFRWTLSHGEFY